MPQGQFDTYKLYQFIICIQLYIITLFYKVFIKQTQLKIKLVILNFLYYEKMELKYVMEIVIMDI